MAMHEPSANQPRPAAKVWDLPVRGLHWLLVLCVAMAWLSRHDVGDGHRYWGYGAAGLVVLRFVWGFTGGRYARFAQFVRPARVTWRYLGAVVRRVAPRYIGHNPLGGWMVLALITSVGLLGFTGWLYTTDMFWGYAWLSDLHMALGWTLLGLIALHVLGVLFTSVAHRENLVKAMVTGRKPAATQGDVDD